MQGLSPSASSSKTRTTELIKDYDSTRTCDFMMSKKIQSDCEKREGKEIQQKEVHKEKCDQTASYYVRNKNNSFIIMYLCCKHVQEPFLTEAVPSGTSATVFPISGCVGSITIPSLTPASIAPNHPSKDHPLKDFHAKQPKQKGKFMLIFSCFCFFFSFFLAFPSMFIPFFKH